MDFGAGSLALTAAAAMRRAVAELCALEPGARFRDHTLTLSGIPKDR